MVLGMFELHQEQILHLIPQKTAQRDKFFPTQGQWLS